jgi:Kef-type K+ transport system membrane component KefB
MKSKDKMDMKAILFEEAIRTMALVGIVMFGVLPISYMLGADVSSIAMIAFPAVLLSFPCITLIRIRTGYDLKLHTNRGWYIATAIAFALVLFISILGAITEYASWNQAIVWIATSVIFITVFSLLGARLMKIQ